MTKILKTFNLILFHGLLFVIANAQSLKPEIYVQTGHAAAVNSVAFSADGKFLASAGDDKTVKLWLVATQSELRTFAGHKSNVNSVAFDPRGGILASASYDKTIKFWNIETGLEIRTLQGHTGSVEAIAFSPNGEILVSASRDKNIKMWNVATGAEISTLTGHTEDVISVVYSPDGATLASGGWDGKIKIWDAKTGKFVKNLGEKLNYVKTIAFSADGKIIAALGKFWEIASGREIEFLADYKNSNATAFSRDGKMFANVSGSNILLWKTEKNEMPRTLSGKFVVSFGGIESIAFSPDGKLMASGSSDKSVRFWDLTKLIETKTLTAHSKGIQTVAVSPDGKLIATGSADQTIKIWNAASGAEKFTLAGGEVTIYSTTFSPDGKMLVSGGDRLVLWDVETGKEIRRFKGHDGLIRAAVFSPNGKTLVSCGSDYTIKIWNVETGAEIRTLRGHSGAVEFISISPNGEKIVSSSDDGTIRMWKAADGKSIYSVKGGSRIGTILASAYSVVFSPNGELLAVGGQGEGIILLNVENGKEVKRFQDSSAFGQISISPDGKLLTNAGGTSVEIWNIANGRKQRELSGHRERIGTVVFSSDGTQIISGSDDFTAKIWNVDENPTLSISPPALYGQTVEFSSDVSAMAFFGAGYNNNIALWDLKKGKRLPDLETTGQQIGAVAFHPTKPLVASYDWGNNIIIYDRNTSRRVKIKTDPTIKGGTTGSLRFSNDGGTLLLKLVDGTSVFWEFDIDKFEVKKTSPNLDEAITKNYSRENYSLELGLIYGFYKIDNSKITLFHPETKKELCSLITLDDNEWLVTTPDGFFDGTPKAWKQMFWRFNNNTFDYGAVELYFNDFFYPNLLQDVLAGDAPQVPAGNDLAAKDRRQPKVEIVSVGGQPKDKITAESVSDKRTIVVSVETADNTDEKKQSGHNSTSGAQDLRLFRNGSLVKIWHDDVFKLGKSDGCEQVSKPTEPRRVRCQTEIPVVAGANDFTAYAFNSSDVKSNDDTVSIKGADTLKRGGALYVLAVGVNKYANAGYNLNFAVPDVEEISAALKNQQDKFADAKLRQYVKTEIITLKDETATRSNILLALRRFSKDGAAKTLPANLCANLAENQCAELKTELAKIKPTEPEDALIIYYAGHGTSRGPRFYLLPHDFAGKEEQGVSDIELNDALENVDAGRLLTVIDACQSGQALGEKTEGRGPMNSKGLAQLAYDKGMLILTAAQSQQSALEAVNIGGKQVRHGLLTYALLEAINNPQSTADRDANKQLWEREWFDYSTEQVPLLQIEAMKQRRIDLKQGQPDVKGRNDIVYLDGDDPNLDPAKRQVQTPRVFYRRETEINPLILAAH